MRILVVTRSFYRVERLKRKLPQHEIEGCFRDYHLDSALSKIPDLVLSDGTCKTRIDGGESFGIYFDIRSKAKAHGLKVRSLFFFEMCNFPIELPFSNRKAV